MLTLTIELEIQYSHHNNIDNRMRKQFYRGKLFTLTKLLGKSNSPMEEKVAAAGRVSMKSQSR